MKRGCLIEVAQANSRSELIAFLFLCSVFSVLVWIVVGYKELLIEGRPFVASLLRALRHLDRWRCHVFIGHLAENVAQAIQAGTALVIGLHGEPWGFRDMRLGKHGVFRFRVLHPAVARLDVHRTIFQRRSSLSMRSWKRFSCSLSLMENQYLSSKIPSCTSICSNCGHDI